MRITKTTHPELWKLNPQWSSVTHLLGLTVDDEEYERFRKEADRIYSHLNVREREIAAIHAVITHPGAHGHGTPEKAATVSRPVDTHHTRLLIAILIVMLFLLIWAVKSHAEPPPELQQYVLANLKIFPPHFFPQGSAGIINPSQFIFDASNNLKMNCVIGCSASAGFTDNSTFTVGTTVINPIGAFYTSGAAPALSSGNAGRVRMDANSYLYTDCVIGCSGGSLTNNNAAPAANNSGALGGIANAANPTWVEGNQVLFSVDLAGYQRTIVNRWAGGVLGAMANYGTTPGAVLVPGVNAFVTNTVPVTLASTTVTGTVAVTQSTSPWVVSNGGTFAVQAAQSGNWTSRIVGNAGAVLDAVGQNVAAPASWLGVGCQFFTSPTTLTNGNGTYLNCDTASNLFTKMNSWLGSTAPTVGSKASASSIPVVVASDQGAIAVTLTSTTLTGTSTVAGNKTNNNAAPGATNVGDLPAVANAATPSWTEGNQVAESVDLSGRMRIVGITGDNVGAAASNRAPILPSIYQTSYLAGTAATAGRDGALSQGTDGLLWTAQLPAIRPASFHASASFAGSSTTAAAHLAGNASNTVLVTKVSWTCTQTTAGILTVTVNKTSAASTGGTAATMTAIPDDSNYSAASSVAQSFTGTGPTVGTPVGQIDAAKVGCGATTSVNDDIYMLNLRQKPIVLRGTAQTLEIGTGAAITGGNVTVTWEWIETATITP